MIRARREVAIKVLPGLFAPIPSAWRLRARGARARALNHPHGGARELYGKQTKIEESDGVHRCEGSRDALPSRSRSAGDRDCRNIHIAANGRALECAHYGARPSLPNPAT